MKIWTPAKIFALRKRLRLSQTALAVRLGVGFSTVNRWEMGRNAPTGISIIALDNLRDEMEAGS